MYAKTKFYLWISSNTNDIMFYVIVPHLFLLILQVFECFLGQGHIITHIE